LVATCSIGLSVRRRFDIWGVGDGGGEKAQRLAERQPQPVKLRELDQRDDRGIVDRPSKLRPRRRQFPRRLAPLPFRKLGLGQDRCKKVCDLARAPRDLQRQIRLAHLNAGDRKTSACDRVLLGERAQGVGVRIQIDGDANSGHLGDRGRRGDLDLISGGLRGEVLKERRAETPEPDDVARGIAELVLG
jgi:hypothetical protein